MKKILPLIFITTALIAQTENWVVAANDDEKVTFINVSGLSEYKEGDIFLWVLEEYQQAFKMEEIDDDIYKVKSYYIINRELQRYSLLEVIYYDENNNVIKFFKYERNFEKPEFKYSSPILKNSDMQKILYKCLDVIGTVTNN